MPTPPPTDLAIDLGGGTGTAGLRYAAAADGGALLVLGHGAGAGQRHPFMTTVAHGLAGRGVDVVTFDFPYMHARRRAPDRAPVLEACFRSAIDAARRASPAAGPVLAGGKSMGGRIATHLAAQRLPGLDGVVALGYPLHPPGRPDQPRTAHLPDVAAPLLVVQGEHDAFGTPGELAPVIAAMRAPVTLHVVAGGDHSFGVKTRPAREVLDEVVDVVAAWIATIRRGLETGPRAT